MLPAGVHVLIVCLVATVALAVAVMLCTKAKHSKRSKSEVKDTAPPEQKQEVQSIAVERSKVVMVQNAAYNIFQSNSYVFHAETGGHQTLTLERSLKPAQPQSSHSQLAEEEGMPLKVPPRVKRSISRPLPSYFSSEEEFQRASGWFNPSLEEVICNKLHMAVEVFQSTGDGVYFMKNARKERAKYVGWSSNLHATLLGLLHGLYVKGRSQHNPLQREILCHCPLAEDWSLTIWPCRKEDLLLEHAKRVLEHNCLHPCGLNKLVVFAKNKEGWDDFCTWYMANKRGSNV